MANWVQKYQRTFLGGGLAVAAGGGLQLLAAQYIGFYWVFFVFLVFFGIGIGVESYKNYDYHLYLTLAHLNISLKQLCLHFSHSEADSEV